MEFKIIIAYFIGRAVGIMIGKGRRNDDEQAD